MRSPTPCPWRTAPAMPPCYRETVAADLDALLAAPDVDAACAARTLAAAAVGLSGAELAAVLADLRDRLRETPGVVRRVAVAAGGLFDGVES